MQDALSTLQKALVANELIKHPQVDVKVAVASCISEITRISAPEAPYEDDVMKEAFQLIVSSFDNISDKSSRSFAKRVSILETVSKVRSCVVILDLKCDSLIVEMFGHFLREIRYIGHIDVSVTSAAFVVAVVLLLQRGIPRFSQLSSTMFGLFYCGYLPCFWVKFRCSLSVPALYSRITAGWPILLGGQSHWTVGLVASLVTISSIIAADTYAFMGGKVFGRTPLTEISPKKTWEGTVIGLGGCIATSVLLTRIFCWPTSLLSSIALGLLTFIGSVFGDLT